MASNGNASPGHTEQKPAILCLHGRGTSGHIFQIQLARLRMLLKDTFNFFFLDGPFECPAGPGVLPFFEGFDPYYAWKNTSGIGGIATPETVSTIQEAIENHIALTGQTFVGAMGFSQGGTVTAGLLLRQQALNEKERHVDGFRFGVCLMSSCPPLILDRQSMDGLEKIHIPTLHVVGTRDDIRQMSRDMASKYCKEKTAEVLEFNAGHYMPQAMADIENIAERILKLHQETSKTPSVKD